MALASLSRLVLCLWGKEGAFLSEIPFIYTTKENVFRIWETYDGVTTLIPLFVVTNQQLSLTNRCYQPTLVTNQQLLPTNSCYQPTVVTNQQLLPTNSCYQPTVVTNQQLLPTNSCYQPTVVTNQLLLTDTFSSQHF